jgi:hypothetical protein
MLRSSNASHRLVAACLTGWLMVPFLGAMHDHGVDHSGAVLHIETDHGGHFHPPPELEDRQVSQGLTPMAVPGPCWSLPQAPRPRASAPATTGVERVARPPPPPLRSRPPPLPS